MNYTDHLELYQLNVGGRNYGENGFLVHNLLFFKKYFSELLLMNNIQANFKSKNPSNFLIYVCPISS